MPDELAILFGTPSRATEVFVKFMHLQQEAQCASPTPSSSPRTNRRAMIHGTVDVTPSKGALIGGWLGVLAGPLAITGGIAAGAL